MISVAAPIGEIIEFPVLSQPKALISVKNDESRSIAIPRTSLPRIDTKLNKSIRLSEVFCAAWALALRCYTCDTVTFAYEDISTPVSDLGGDGDLTSRATQYINGNANTHTTIPAKDLSHVRYQRHLKRLLTLYPFQLQTVESLYDAVRAECAKSGSDAYTLPEIQREGYSNQSFKSCLIHYGELKQKSPLDRDFLEHSPEYDVTVHAMYVENGIDIVIIYKPSAIAEDLVASVADTLCQTFNLVVNHQGVDLSRANFLGPSNLSKIFGWNSNPPAAAVECAHELFRQRAMLQPNASAIDSWDSQMTYAELDSLSNRLSFLLMESGVGPEIIVPLCFEKSAWYVVAMIAVLKAGGAFVPLDPAHPSARLQEIVDQVNATVILTSSKHHALFTYVDVAQIILNEDLITQLPTQLPQDHSTPCVTPENLAYVIFTSGSTGMPKGTMIQHQSFCSGALRQGKAAKMSMNSRIFQFASYAFDVSILEILTGLIFGACICIPNDQLGRADLARSMNDFRTNWAFLTPSVLRVLSPEQVPLLKTLVLGGESMSKSDMSTWAGKLQLMNGYGPSECSVAAAANTELTPYSSPQNIGRAIGGICWIVDPDNHDVLLPVGAIGELLIQGPIVARGYLNDPTKTASVFIESPAWLPTQDLPLWNRFYKTGDLVRYDDNGMLHFVGRKDHQVKLNGQRMELGEVEHHLWSDSLIQHGMALVPRSGLCKSRLVGVVSLQSQLSASRTQDNYHLQLLDNEQVTMDLRNISQRLSGLLPAYMVPTVWIALGNFPITSSGKLDRKRVTDFVTQMSKETFQSLIGKGITDFVTNMSKEKFQSLIGNTDTSLDDQPVSQSVSLARKVWSGILDVPEEQIHRSNTFLSVGGDSITAMAATSEFRKLGITVTVADLLRHNLGKIAELVEASNIASIPILNDDNSQMQRLPISRYQRVLLERSVAGEIGLHHVSTFRLKRKFRMQQIMNALDAIVYAHPTLSSHFEKQDDVWLQAFILHNEVDSPSYHFSVNHISNLQEAQATISRRQASLNTIGHPNFLVDLFVISDAQYLSIVAHGAAIDSSSLSIILNSLNDILKSEPVPLKNELEQNVTSRNEFFDAWNEQLRAENTGGKPTLLGVDGTASTPKTSNDITIYATDGFEFDVHSSQFLKGPCNLVFDTKEEELLLAAMALSYDQISSDSLHAPLVLVEGYRTQYTPKGKGRLYVGQFSDVLPIEIHVAAESHVTHQLIRETKDQLRLSQPLKTSMEMSKSPDIVFKYSDHSEIAEDAVMRPEAIVYSNESMDLAFPAPLQVSVSVYQGRFKVTIFYMKGQESKLSLFGNKYRENLTQLIEMMATNTRREFTLADLPLLSLDYSALEKLNHQQLSKLGLDVDHVEDIYPCSPLQKGLLMSQARQQGNYDVSIAWEASPCSNAEHVDVDKLKSAWQSVVDIHPALRTVFLDGLEGNEAFVQLVLKNSRTEVSVINCPQTDVESILNQSADLGSHLLTPPHRFSIYVTVEGKIFCRVDASHTIVDGVSKSLMLRDLKRAYAGELRCDSYGVKYSDFIKFIIASDPAASIAFWKDHLSGVEPCYFPVLAPDRTVRELEHIAVTLDQSGKTIHDFCISHSMTVSNLVQTVWALVLKCFVGRDDVCFGYLASGRDAPVEGIVDMVGPTISVLICRAFLDDSTIVKDALQTFQTEFLDSLSHQHCSLAEIQHALGLSGMALFNTGISFQTVSGIDTDINAASINFEDLVVKEPTEYNITLHVTDSSDSVDIKLGYWTDGISRSQAQSISGTFSSIMNSIMEDPESRIDQLNFLGSHDLSQITSWNQDTPERSNMTIPDLIYQQISNAPNDIAIQSPSVTLTYEALGKLSSSLSQYLVQSGIGPGLFVPLAFEKSAWAIVSMLAVLATGAAFVPLDPATPVERLREAVEQTSAKFVLTSPRYAEKWKDLGPTIIIVNQNTLNEIENYTTVSQKDLDAVKPSPQHDAYVIFTSGSTGKPKGCVVQHSAFCSGALVQGRLASLGPSSRVLQFASYSFDVSLLEIMTSLIFGACICVPNEDLSKDIKRCINEFSINWTFLTPSVLKLLNPADVPSLKTLVLGGEALSKGDIMTWADKVQLYNGYGPSECSVAAAANPELTPTTDRANIGRAIGGVLWVVDSNQPSRLLPIGAVGELLISGPILAREYLNNPEKTTAAFIEQQSFIPGSTETERFYRTGDLVRYNADGTIHFIGRSDGQVKIRGQRVELGEIEYNIERDEQIQHALTLLPSQGPFRKQLLAVVSFKEIQQATEADTEISLIPSEQRLEAMEVVTKIADTISGTLPVYMVPAVWVTVNRIPLLPSGKLDRKKVRAWIESLDDSTYEQIAGMDSQAVGRAPSTPTEYLLRGIWAFVLNRPEEQISMERSFQSLGGDSISAMQVMSQCRDAKISLSVKDILQCPTIGQLALRAKPLDEGVVSVEDDSLTPFNLSPQQTWEFGLKAPCDLNRYNTTFLLSVHSEKDILPYIEATVERHPMLRARFSRDAAGHWMQYIPLDRSNSYLYQAIKVPNMEAIKPFIAPNQPGFDLQQGPLFRAIIFELPDQSRFLALTVHHMVIDTVSWRILLQSLEQGLAGADISSGRSDSFALWCRRLKEHAEQEWTPESVLPFQVPTPMYDYWGMKESINLFETEIIEEFSLDPEITALLMGKCNDRFETKPLDIFLSALFSAFSSTFQDRPLPAFFAYSHGRDDFGGNLDISNTIGWFTSSTPVIISPSKDVVESLQAVRDVRASIPGNGVPYWATRWLSDAGNAAFAHHSPFEFSMNYLGQYQQLERDDSLLRYVDLEKPKADGSGSRLIRTALVETQAIVIADSLQIKFVYNSLMGRQAQLLEWQGKVKEALLEIAHRLGGIN